jgi:hypothetical protein
MTDEEGVSAFHRAAARGCRWNEHEPLFIDVIRMPDFSDVLPRPKPLHFLSPDVDVIVLYEDEICYCFVMLLC